MLVRCTCVRDARMVRLLPDPACPAPSHVRDQVDEALADLGALGGLGGLGD